MNGAGYMWSGGHMRSLLGSCVRAEAEILIGTDEAYDRDALVAEAFECVFGKEVVARTSITYVPAGHPDRVARAQSRIGLTSADVEHVHDFAVRMNREFRSSNEHFYLFNVHDQEMIHDDVGVFRREDL